MPKREDESYREIFHNGHPPGCTCAACNEIKYPREPRLGEQRFRPWSDEVLPKKPRSQWWLVALAFSLLVAVVLLYIWLAR